MLHSVNESAVVSPAPSSVQAVETPPVPQKPKRGNHTWSVVPPAGLMEIPGALLRKCHVLAVVGGISDNTLATRIKNGDFPKPDIYSGKSPLWRVQTVRDWLNGGVVQQLEQHRAELRDQLRSAPDSDREALRREDRRLLARLRRIRASKPAPSTPTR